jgi:hypothetical protein
MNIKNKAYQVVEMIQENYGQVYMLTIIQKLSKEPRIRDIFSLDKELHIL